MNAVKPAIKVAQYNTIAGFATIEITCPLRLLCEFVPQIQNTLNIMRTSRNNSNISVYKDMEGPFDWNMIRIVPSEVSWWYTTFRVR